MLEFASVVHYEGYSKALLSFRFSTLKARVRVEREDGTEWGVYELRRSDPYLYLTNVSQGELFAVFAEDACGTFRAVGWFETWPGKDSPEGIRVSKALFRAMELFVQQEAKPLPLFLEGFDEIPVLDRLWFLQQYLYGGAPFGEDFGRSYPPDDFWAAMPEIGGCHCELLFYQSARPSIMQEGVIHPVEAEHRGRLGRNVGYELKRAYAEAAMDVELLVKGCRSGGADYRLTFNAPVDEESAPLAGAAYGLLSYHLLCVGGDLIKENCDCTRCVHINASLSEKLNADVALKQMGCVSVGKDKWGYASAQVVYALVRTSWKDGYQFLAGGNSAVKKEAAIQLNTDFFLGIVDIVAALAPTLDSFTLQVVDIDQLANAVKNVIGEPVIAHTGEGGKAIAEKELFRMYDRQVCFQANDPNRVIMWVLGSVTGAGRRKWRSHAYVQTGFHMDGIVQASFEDGCCGDQLGNWVAKSLIDNDLFSTYQMQAMVVEDLALWPWDGWSPFDGGLPGEYGYLTHSWGFCDSSGLLAPGRQWVSEWWQGRSSAVEVAEEQAAEVELRQVGADPFAVRDPVLLPAQPECPCRLEVVDLQGRVWHVEEGLSLESPHRLRERLQRQGRFPHSGIYILRLVGQGGVRADKVFVQW